MEGGRQLVGRLLDVLFSGQLAVAPVVTVLDQLRATAHLNDATRTRSFTISSARSQTSGASERRLTPNGRCVRSFVSAIASASWRKSSVAEAMMPSPPALEVAEASFAAATSPYSMMFESWRRLRRSRNWSDAKSLPAAEPTMNSGTAVGSM